MDQIEMIEKFKSGKLAIIEYNKLTHAKIIEKLIENNVTIDPKEMFLYDPSFSIMFCDTESELNESRKNQEWFKEAEGIHNFVTANEFLDGDALPDRAETLASVKILCNHDSYSDGRLADQFTDDLIKTVAELQDISLVLAQVEDKVSLLDAMDEEDILAYVRYVMGKVVE